MDHQHSELAEKDEEAANRQTASLAAIAVTLLLLIVGLFLVQELRTKAAIEDCLMAGRTNCDKPVQSARVTRPRYHPGVPIPASQNLAKHI